MIEFFTHPERVANPREAAALLRQLGVDRVRMTRHRTHSWVLQDPVAIQRVLRDIEPGTGTEVAIEGITREATLPHLERVVTGDAQFISIAGNNAWLRVWPARDEAFVDELALDREHAFERFRPAATVTWINASISSPGADVVAALPHVLAELDQPLLEVDLEIALDTALALVLDYSTAELEWTGGCVIQFPAGEILTYRLKPPPEFEAEWQRQIAKALAAIR